MAISSLRGVFARDSLAGSLTTSGWAPARSAVDIRAALDHKGSWYSGRAAAALQRGAISPVGMWWWRESVEGGRRRSHETQRGGNLVTDAAYSDFKLHVEFRYPRKATAACICVAATRRRSRLGLTSASGEATAASARSTDS